MPDSRGIPRPRRGSQPGLGRHGSSYGKAQRRDNSGGGGGKKGCAVTAVALAGGLVTGIAAAVWGLVEAGRALI